MTSEERAREALEAIAARQTSARGVIPRGSISFADGAVEEIAKAIYDAEKRGRMEGRISEREECITMLLEHAALLPESVEHCEKTTVEECAEMVRLRGDT